MRQDGRASWEYGDHVSLAQRHVLNCWAADQGSPLHNANPAELRIMLSGDFGTALPRLGFTTIALWTAFGDIGDMLIPHHPLNRLPHNPLENLVSIMPLESSCPHCGCELSNEDLLTIHGQQSHYDVIKARKYVGRTNLNAHINGYVFTNEVKLAYLDALALTGRRHQAAQAVEVSAATVSKHIQLDPEFALGVDEAMQAYADKVRETVQRRALEGDLEPIVGRTGKDQDGIIGYKRKYSDNLLAMEAKRVDAEYRQSATLDVNVKMSGVLVVSASLPAMDWQTQYGGQQLPLDPLVGLPGISEQMIAEVADKGDLLIEGELVEDEDGE